MNYTFDTLPAKVKNILLEAGITSQAAMNTLTEQQISLMPRAKKSTVKIIMEAKCAAQPVPRPAVNIAERMREIFAWLDWQHEALSYGLRTIADAEKLYDYWHKTPDLPEFADCGDDDFDVDTIHQHHINAIGYSPLV